MGLFSWLRGGKKQTPPRSEKVSSPGLNSPPVHTKIATSPVTSKAQISWRDGSFPMEVVGESHYQQALISICGKHNRDGHEKEFVAIIALDPSNPHDANAVVVNILNNVVGYLPKEQAQRVGAQMREEDLQTVTCRAKVRGGWRTNQHDEGSYGVRLAIPQHGWIDFGAGRTQPKTPKISTPKAKSSRPEPAKTGPLRGEWVAIMGAHSDGDLAKELAEKGAHIMGSVGKSTSLLVVACERPFTSGVMNSAQYRKAEKRISEGGVALRIVSLSEVRELMS